MAEFVCKDCGAANPADAKFCCESDTYLGWDTNPPGPPDAEEASGSASGRHRRPGRERRQPCPSSESRSTNRS